MDIKMPVMDGCEASQRIRQIDDARKASIPIVAVTAFATQEYSERCLTSGMDKYITKPYTLSNIKELLDALVAEGSAPAAEAPDSSRPRSAASPPPVIDMALLHQRFDGDKELIHAMMKQFLDDGYQQIAELRARAGTREWQLFYDVNHQVKGAAATMSATALLQTSEALENVAEKLLKTHDPAQQQQADALIDEMERLFKEAERLTKKWKQA
ncbi:MAG: response regulator, partial [Cyclonatronaceae bacterium]